MQLRTAVSHSSSVSVSSSRSLRTLNSLPTPPALANDCKRRLPPDASPRPNRCPCVNFRRCCPRRGFKSAVVRHYINTDAQAKYFEEVSGLKLADIPLSPSDKYELNRDNPAPFVREVDLILVRKDIGADQAAKNGKGNRKGLQYFVHRLLARDSKSPVDDSAPDADTESAPTSTPAAITDAANALSQPPSADPTFDEMFPKSDAQIKSPFPKTRRDLAYEETNMRHNYGHRQHFNKLMDLLTSQDKVHKEMTVEEIVAAIDAHYAANPQEKASA